MKKYKLGDKIVLQIIQDDSYGDYKIGDETHGWWTSSELIDNVAEPLSKYIKSMAEKLHNQRAEINRLLKENKELKINANWCDNCAKADSIDEARATGQREAWELAQKIGCYDCDGGFTEEQREEIFGQKLVPMVFHKHTYSEAATKVEAWERQEIHVGDVLLSISTHDKCVVTYICNETIAILWDDGSSGNRSENSIREEFEKVGHIDVDAWLAQIGGESDD